jgi:hypothetical protein
MFFINFEYVNKIGTIFLKLIKDEICKPAIKLFLDII